MFLKTSSLSLLASMKIKSLSPLTPVQVETMFQFVHTKTFLSLELFDVKAFTRTKKEIFCQFHFLSNIWVWVKPPSQQTNASGASMHVLPTRGPIPWVRCACGKCLYFNLWMYFHFDLRPHVWTICGSTACRRLIRLHIDLTADLGFDLSIYLHIRRVFSDLYFCF